MDHQSYACMVILVLFSALTFSSNSSHALQFTVGGKCGWRLNPSENYNHWAARMRFQVNDTLFFKYKKGSDSVLLVNREDYHACNTGGHPKSKLDDGHSVFKFHRSGPFFFISGNKSRCMDGEKLIIVVLAARSKHSSPPPPAPEAPCPISAPPRWFPHSPAPGTDTSPSETPDQETVDGPSGDSTPRDENPAAQPPRRSYAVAFWSSSVLLGSAVSVVISVCLGGFI
ncbi:hypothetical protein OROGR_015339 [Orobanche gracilis]